MANRPVRSSAYQWQIVECVYDFAPGEANIANTWSEDRGLYANQIAQEVIELQDQAIERLWEVTFPTLTDHQAEVCRLSMQGLTQMEIAKVTGTIQQSSVHKVFHGNATYKKGEPHIHHGGMGRKIMKACLRDDTFRQLIEQLAELNEGNKIVYLVQSWFYPNLDQFEHWKVTPIRADGVPYEVAQHLFKVFKTSFPSVIGQRDVAQLRKRYKLTGAQIKLLHQEFKDQLRQL